VAYGRMPHGGTTVGCGMDESIRFVIEAAAAVAAGQGDDAKEESSNE
jgi:hypothetical protein